MADRDAILAPYIDSFLADSIDCVTPANAKEAMDSYMKSTCLELLEYILKNCVAVALDDNNEKRFLYKTHLLTKEQLFENFI